jgi:cysteine synthase
MTAIREFANPDTQPTPLEIPEQMDGRIDAVTVGSGTAGRLPVLRAC